MGVQDEGIHLATYMAIMKSPVAIRESLYKNIILSGGTTLFEKFDERLTREMVALAPATISVQIVAPPNRHHSAWIGGSIMASLSTFQETWIGQKEFKEKGKSVLERTFH